MLVIRYGSVLSLRDIGCLVETCGGLGKGWNGMSLMVQDVALAVASMTDVMQFCFVSGGAAFSFGPLGWMLVIGGSSYHFKEWRLCFA